MAIRFLGLILVALFLNGCDDEESTLPPIISTNYPTKITRTTALSGGFKARQIKDVILEQGVCWSLHDNPTLADDAAIDTNTAPGKFNDLGGFTVLMTGLEPNTWYFVMAFLRTKKDTIYAVGSSGVYFKTLE